MMHHTLKRKQAGLSLLEAMIALGVMSAIFIGINELTSRYSEDTRAMIASQHLRKVGEAAQPYIRDNYAALEAVATDTTPALITVPMLSATGYLQNGYSTTNGYGQAACVLVLKPSPGRLSALVVSEAFNATQQLDDITLAQVAAAVGASGGGVYSTAPTELIGTMAGWRTPIGAFANANATGVRCDGATPGAVQLNPGQPVMALWFEQGDTSSSFLYRDEVPGRPDLNTMNTPILMSDAMAQTVGDLCTTVGALSRDVSGAVVSCQGGTWKRQGSEFWQDGVANFSDLPACDVDSQGHTRVVRNGGETGGANRPRAYTCYGTTWNPLALDNDGNLTVPGRVDVAGQISGQTVRPTLVATEGASCTSYGAGALARDNVGLILSCQSGVWRKGTGQAMGVAAFVTFNGNATPCAAPGGCPILHGAGVSQVVRTNTGRYTIYFSEDLGTSNYAWSGSAAYGDSNMRGSSDGMVAVHRPRTAPKTGLQLGIHVTRKVNSSDNLGSNDSPEVNVIVVR